MINKLADKLADAFIAALRPKLAALIDEQIDRAKKSVGISASEAIRRRIGL